MPSYLLSAISLAARQPSSLQASTVSLALFFPPPQPPFATPRSIYLLNFISTTSIVRRVLHAKSHLIAFYSSLAYLPRPLPSVAPFVLMFYHPSSTRFTPRHCSLSHLLASSCPFSRVSPRQTAVILYVGEQSRCKQWCIFGTSKGIRWRGGGLRVRG